MALSRFFRVPKPKSFLYLTSLRTGTTLITATLLINKVSGLYGILAILTGLQLSPLQLSSYIYSIFALGIAAYLFPHIERQSPLHCVALAWFYLLDSIINAAYTAAFGVAWFAVLAQNKALGGGGAAGTIKDTAGFTDPKYTVTSVDMAVPTAAPGSSGTNPPSNQHDAQLIGHAGDPASTAPETLGAILLQSSSVASITVIALLWALRIYSILVVMAYARGVLRRYIVQRSQVAGQPLVTSSAPGYAEDPFAEGKELGTGWQGRLGRAMVGGLGKRYWLGADEDGGFAAGRSWSGFDAGAGRGANQKGSGSGSALALVERERRRRTGTGPPVLKPIELGGVRKA